MSGGRGGSAVSAGCGAFGLLSVLIAVGLAVWLSSRVLDSTGTTVTAGHRTASIAATPATDLSEGQTIPISGRDFTPNGSVDIFQCARPHTTPLCDRSGQHTIDVDADELGRFNSALTVHRLLRTTGGTFDCAAPQSRCEVRAAEPDSSVSATALLTFGS
jgi:hypothetical protein